MKQNRNVSYLNQNKTKLNYVIKFSLIECSLFITAILRDSGNTPVGNEVFIMVQEAAQYFGKTDELSSWIYYHVQELC